MDNCERVSCRNCGSREMRWVTSLLAVWDGAVLRCGACRQVTLVPIVAASR